MVQAFPGLAVAVKHSQRRRTEMQLQAVTDQMQAMGAAFADVGKAFSQTFGGLAGAVKW